MMSNSAAPSSSSVGQGQREDVLRMVPHVKYKKVDGYILVMSTRLLWVTTQGDHVRISAPYEDIRLQRISSKDKEKVQLQIKMHCTESYTFHFTAGQGRDKQLEDRDAVKELLQQLLPKFRDKVVHEMDHKVSLLKRHPRLYTLYEELVVSGIVSVEEFWDLKVVQEHIQQHQSEQHVGIPSHLLGDVKPVSDGAHGTRYNLTQEMIHAIFRTYPAVQKRHLQLVPREMNESEFWTAFFQSHYFHRDRAQIHEKDVFAPCAQWDDEQMRREAVASLGREMLLDVSRLSDYDLGEGYGLTLEGPQPLLGKGAPSTSSNTSKSTVSSFSKEDVNKKLIHRINYLSLMVLKAQAHKSGAPTDTSTSEAAKKRKLDEVESDACGNREKQLQENILLEDLVEATEEAAVPLRLKSVENYLEGPVARNGTETAVKPQSGHQQPKPLSVPVVEDTALADVRELISTVQKWQADNLQGCLAPNHALTALSDMAGLGGTDSEANLLASVSHQSGTSDGSSQWVAKSLLSNPELEKDFRRLYLVLSELLRHFWLCFPVTTPQLEHKLVNMHESLSKFRATKLEQFKRQANVIRPDVGLCEHMELMLDKAEEKYNAWRTRPVKPAIQALAR